jgi:DNA (cytosine-5)-methyltransferase 1
MRVVATPTSDRGGLSVAGLFAGIGGIERGLAQAGHLTEFLCELEPAARRILKARNPGMEVARDVREVRSLPAVDLLAAGFPCQDLSQAGRTAGIGGNQSGLVGEVFRLLGASGGPTWLLLENVPFMLSLDRGRAMRFLVDCLEELGYMWAYRVVDALSFGVPQRRRRVLLLASRVEDPREVLFGMDAGQPKWRHPVDAANGFYWTEGLRGLGWAADAVPTLKGGSSIGIPSPPAIWFPKTGLIATPDIRDAERLQGFPANWTASADPAGSGARTARWKLVGNAVSVPVARWLGRRLHDPRPFEAESVPLGGGDPWPTAAYGKSGQAWRVDVSMWPERRRRQHLADFLRFPVKPLSLRATQGFLKRADAGSLRFPPGLLDDVALHLERAAGRIAWPDAVERIG